MLRSNWERGYEWQTTDKWWGVVVDGVAWADRVAALSVWEAEANVKKIIAARLLPEPKEIVLTCLGLVQPKWGE
jgi:hypothetical protein